MTSKKIDPKHLERLNDPRRLKIQNPDLIWEKLELVNPKILVEIGAGTGFFTFPFGEKLKNGALFALDVSDQMLLWLKDHIPAKIIASIVPVRMGENHIPLKSEVADLLYMVNLHHELEQPERVLVEAFRVLKKKGKVAIIDWQKDAAYGPPQAIRVAKETVYDQLIKIGIGQIVEHNILPYHYFLVGKKV
jgi:ubiquinone/menaquinone biosynthesis C-methylase UbiE